MDKIDTDRKYIPKLQDEQMNDFDENLEWQRIQAEIEANSLREFALRPIPLLTLKSESVKTENGMVNFLTVDSGINMEDILDLVVSEPKQHPRDKTLVYSTILMLNKKDANQPFLAIYTRPGDEKVLGSNGLAGLSWEADLKEWVLLNRNGSTKRHSIIKNKFPANRRKFIDQER